MYIFSQAVISDGHGLNQVVFSTSYFQDFGYSQGGKGEVAGQLNCIYETLVTAVWEILLLDN